MDIQTPDDLSGTEAIAFAICLLNKCRREFPENFAVGMKIVSAIRTLVDIQTSIEEDLNTQILKNAAKLDTKQETMRYSKSNEKIKIADDVQIKHGRWVAECEGLPFCSVCDYNGFGHIMPPYCPNCGAKMDLEDEDDKN